MHRTRWSGQQWGRGKPFRLRHLAPLGVSLVFGATAAVSATVSTGGCGSVEADSSAAGQPGCDPERLPNYDSIARCLRDNCCQQLTACSKDQACWSCFESGSGMACAGNNTYLAVSQCSNSMCGDDGSAGGSDDVTVEQPAVRTESTLVVVHASADLRPFRACIQDDQGTWVEANPVPDDPGSVMPHSNVIGVAPGGALVLRNADQFTDYGARKLTLNLIPTSELQGKEGKTCKELICQGLSSCLDPQDYEAMPATSVGLIAGSTSVEMFVIRGCTGSNGTPERCGSDYTGTRNLGITVTKPYELDTTSQPAEGAVRLTPAQLSQSAEALWSVEAGQGLLLTYGSLGDNNGVALIGSSQFGEVLSTQEVDVPQAGDAELPAYAQKGFTLSAPQGDGGNAPVMTFSLAQVQGLSSPTDLPPSFWNSSSHFLIALIGDATDPTKQLEQPDGGENPLFDGYGLHVLAVPLLPRASVVDP